MAKKKAKGEKQSEWQKNLETASAIQAIDEDLELKREERITAEREGSEKVKHGIILTGGIDSTVMLYQLKKELPEEAQIIPIVLGSKKDVAPTLNELDIKSSVKTFDIDDTDADESKMLPLLEWAQKNKIDVIHFSANADESLEGIPGKKFDYFQRLNALAIESGIRISTPFSTVTKEAIIKDAVDKYDIDLSQLAEPRKVKSKQVENEEGDIITEVDLTDEAYQRIRDKGFKQAFSVKWNTWIPDPFPTKERIELEEAEAEEEAEAVKEAEVK